MDLPIFVDRSCLDYPKLMIFSFVVETRSILVGSPYVLLFLFFFFFNYRLANH
jgi:hypothetical protein